jgi:iron complex outermembrane recepter protein
MATLQGGDMRSVRSLFTAVLFTIAVVASSGSAAAPAEGADSVNSPATLTEIVVTARRREEDLQQVPVSVTALDAADLQSHSVQTIQDLQTVTPGLRVQGLGSNANVVISLRGMTRTPSGEGASAVVPYFAEVPMTAEGTILPTFDLANIQVLKGPQGTLFGRNTTGGAILITPAGAAYDWSGYLRGEYGNFDYSSFEGAVNIPLSSDRLALRIAGQTRRRDGYTQNLGVGPDLNGTHSNAVRASLRFDPIEHLDFTLIFDYTSLHESAPAAINIGIDPGFFSAIAPQFAPTYNAFLQSQLEQQQAWGPHKSATSIAPFNDETLWGLTQTTRYEIGAVTLKNIAGYRAVRTTAESDVDGLSGPLPAIPLPSPPFPAGAEVPPTPLFLANREVARHSLSDELQAVGNSFSDRLSWIAGAFYSEDAPDGTNGSNFNFLGQGAFQSAYTTIKNEALFGQIGWKLSRWVEGLSIDLGVRQNWDQTRGCGIVAAVEYATPEQCFATAASTGNIGAGVVTHDGHATTWTLGLDYQLSPMRFLYAVTRRGYREGGVNLPQFIVTPGTGTVATTNTKGILGPYQTYQPERVTDFELGFKSDWQLGPWHARANIAAFETKYRDAQIGLNVSAALYSALNPNGPLDPLDAPQDQTVYYNGGALTIRGVDLDGAIGSPRSFSLTFSGNFVDQHVDSRTPVSPILSPVPPSISTPTPRFSYTLGANYLLPLHPWQSDLLLQADYYSTQGWQILDTRVPGYQLVNLRLDWKRLLGGSLDLGAFVRNALDRNYVTGGGLTNNNLPVRNVFYGEPRMYGIDLIYHLGEH